jgi:hypothetical protein
VEEVQEELIKQLLPEKYKAGSNMALLFFHPIGPSILLAIIAIL